MNKTFSLLLAAVLTIATVPAVYATQTANPATPATTPETTVQKPEQPVRPSKEEMKKQFEQRLNLTDKQKAKAKALHEKGKEQMKPIIDQMHLKYQEIEAVKKSRMSGKMQEERIAEIKNELKDLKKQADEIRKKNSQEFERILNRKQKAELEKMKAEGRARFEKLHQSKPAFQGMFNTPGIFSGNGKKPTTAPEAGPWGHPQH